MGYAKSYVAMKILELMTGLIHVLGTDIANFPCLIDINYVNNVVSENVRFSKKRLRFLRNLVEFQAESAGVNEAF